MGTIIHLLCTDAPGPSRMFTEGETYQAIYSGLWGDLLMVLDDLGRERYLSRDTLSFITGHEVRWGMDVPQRAFFKEVEK